MRKLCVLLFLLPVLFIGCASVGRSVFDTDYVPTGEKLTPLDPSSDVLVVMTPKDIPEYTEIGIITISYNEWKSIMSKPKKSDYVEEAKVQARLLGGDIIVLESVVKLINTQTMAVIQETDHAFIVGKLTN